jgi:hypothetical protein
MVVFSTFQGMRLYVVSNTSRDNKAVSSARIEGWTVYNTDLPVRSYSPTATLTALGPFLAYRNVKDTFKWVFIGSSDADTAFFPRAAANVVRNLNPDMPYFLTGNVQKHS